MNNFRIQHIFNIKDQIIKINLTWGLITQINSCNTLIIKIEWIWISTRGCHRTLFNGNNNNINKSIMKISLNLFSNIIVKNKNKMFKTRIINKLQINFNLINNKMLDLIRINKYNKKVSDKWINKTFLTNHKIFRLNNTISQDKIRCLLFNLK